MKWISVKDHLPEYDEKALDYLFCFVVVRSTYDGKPFVIYADFDQNERVFIDPESGIKINAEYWAKWPEPPKEAFDEA